MHAVRLSSALSRSCACMVAAVAARRSGYATLAAGRRAAAAAVTSRSSLPSASAFATPAAAAAPRRSMFIQTQTTPNAASLKFLPGREVSAVSADFNSYREAARSPLATLLFGIDGVRSVYLGGEFVSINIGDGADWALVKPQVFAAIMDHYASGKPALLDPSEGGAAVSSTTILPTDSEVVSMIKELLEVRIRPHVQEDGGDIDFRSFDEVTGKVLVQMQGSCKGCSSSAITLKNGIENMLMHYVPEVKCVEEYVDEEVAAVSEDALKKLEQKLEDAKRAEQVIPIPTASAI